MPFMPNERLKGAFYWPVEHYSIAADNLCWHAPDMENTDCLCVKPAGHKGAHEYVESPTIKAHSHKATPSQFAVSTPSNAGGRETP